MESLAPFRGKTPAEDDSRSEAGADDISPAIIPIIHAHDGRTKGMELNG